MYYVVSNEIKCKKEYEIQGEKIEEKMVLNWIGIFDDDDRLIIGAPILDDKTLFVEDDEPERIARILEVWLESLKVEDVISFLREHSKELRKGKLQRDAKQIEKKIRKLDEEEEKLSKEYEEKIMKVKKVKEKLRKRYEELLAEDREGIEKEEAKKE